MEDGDRPERMIVLRMRGAEALLKLVAAVETLAAKAGVQSGITIVPGPPKKQGRAWAKVVGKYNGDPAGLLDMCRVTVVCDTAEQLARFVEAWAAAPRTLRCPRIKARLDPHYDARDAGGYRDLLINVVVPLGARVECICEVQVRAVKSRCCFGCGLLLSPRLSSRSSLTLLVWSSLS